jgi:uncharacterized short protein YbdD (DUF466 family)
MKAPAAPVVAAGRQDAAGARADAPSRQARLSAVLAGVRRAYLQVFGIPDYERYLAHMNHAHPGSAPLSRREFCARAIDRKYSRNGPRCC